MNISYPSVYDPAAAVTDLYLTAYTPDGTIIRDRSQSGITTFAPISSTYWLPSGVSYDGAGIWSVWDNQGVEYIPEFIAAPGSSSGSSGSSGGIGLGNYTPIMILGPDGSPNGTLAASPQTIVVTSTGEVFVKTVGNGDEGWTQTR